MHTIEDQIDRLNEALTRSFGPDCSQMPKTTTAVTFGIGHPPFAKYITFSDGFISGCANQGRAMDDSDVDLVEAFNLRREAPADKIVWVDDLGTASLIDP
jgi:hypothetical protein